MRLNVSTFPHSIFRLAWPLVLGYLHTGIMLPRGRERESRRGLLFAHGRRMLSISPVMQLNKPCCQLFAVVQKVCKTQLCPDSLFSHATVTQQRGIFLLCLSQSQRQREQQQAGKVNLSKIADEPEPCSSPTKGSPQLTQFDSPLQKCLDFCKSCNLAGLNGTSLAYRVISGISWERA